jgi:lysophospholipase-3
MNGKEKSMIICHSMGCPVMLYFLNHQPQAWKDMYVKSFVTLAGPWGGAVKAIKAFTSGDNLGVIVVPALTIRKDERTFPSLAFLMPSDEFWGHDEVLMVTGEKSYTTANYKELFEDIDFEVGYNMWLDTRNLTYKLDAPNVEVHCIHGYGVHTMEHLDYKEDTFPDHQPKISFGDGDGTVNTRSLQGCLRWQGKQNQTVHYGNYSGIDHMSVMTDAAIINYLLSVAIN